MAKFRNVSTKKKREKIHIVFRWLSIKKQKTQVLQYVYEILKVLIFVAYPFVKAD